MAFSAQWTKEGIDTKNENVSKQDQKKNKSQQFEGSRVNNGEAKNVAVIFPVMLD